MCTCQGGAPTTHARHQEGPEQSKGGFYGRNLHPYRAARERLAKSLSIRPTATGGCKSAIRGAFGSSAINAALREHGLTSHDLINGLKKGRDRMDRKVSPPSPMMTRRPSRAIIEKVQTRFG